MTKDSKKLLKALNPKAILDEKVTVKQDGQFKKLSPIEVGLRKILHRALGGDMRAVKRIMNECIRAEVIMPLVQEPYSPEHPIVPDHWEIEEWSKNFDKYGLPPWPGDDDGFSPTGRENYKYWRKYGVNKKGLKDG